MWQKIRAKGWWLCTRVVMPCMGAQGTMRAAVRAASDCGCGLIMACMKKVSAHTVFPRRPAEDDVHFRRRKLSYEQVTITPLYDVTSCPTHSMDHAKRSQCGLINMVIWTRASMSQMCLLPHVQVIDVRVIDLNTWDTLLDTERALQSCTNS